MRQSAKRLVALILAIAMSLSLLSSNVWAAELEPPLEDGSASVQSSEEPAPEEETAEEDAPTEEENPAEESIPTEEATIPTADNTESEEAMEENEPASMEEESAKLKTQEIVDSGNCGEQGSNVTWTLDDEGTLKISGSGAMKNYYYRHYGPFYRNKYSIRTVVVGDNVTSIGDYAFYQCANLTSVTIPDSVISIGDWVFCACSSLTSVTIPDGLVSIGAYAFSWCSSLKSINIPVSVTSIGEGAFEDCSSLTSINVLRANTTYCSFGGVLFNKNQSELIRYPAGKKDAGYTIPNSVTSIGEGSFDECSNLTSVTIPNSVTSIGRHAFEECDSLTSITIPNSVTSIGEGAFEDCSSLTSITIPDSVTSIGGYAFWICSSLTDVYFCGNAPKDLGSSAFDGVTATVHYPANNTTWTDEIKQALGGNLTWVDWNPEDENPTAVFDPQILSFKYDYYSCTENSSVGVALNCYTGQNKPQKISFSCSDDSVTFSEPTVYSMHLLDDGDWVISTHVTCKKAGKYTITATVDGYSAQTTIGVLPEEPSYTGYAAEKESTTNEQYVQRRFNELKNAIDKYLKVLNNAVDADSSAPAKIDQLMEKDQAKKYPALTLDPQMSEDKEAKLAAYAGLNAFYEYMADREPGKLKKIDLSHPVSQIAIDLTNDVFKGNFLYREKLKYNERCIVSVDISGYWSSFSGSITVTTPTHRQYKCVANDPEAAIQTMALYIKELRDLEADVMEEGVKSYMREMRKVSYLSDITKEQFTELFSSIYDHAKKKGYGKITKYAAALYDGYTISKQISSIKSEADLQKKLDSADKLLTQLEKLNYTDSSIEDKTIQGALEAVEKADKAVEDALYNYMFHPDQNMDIERDIKDKIRDKVTNVWNKTNKAWKKITGQCPVKMTVRSKNGSVLGYAEDNYCEYDDSIFIDVNGDVKTIYIPDDMDITVEMTGTRSGTMTYTIEEYADGKPVGRKNFYNVPLEKNGVYTQSISSGSLGANVRDNPLTTDKGNTVIADEYISADENAVCTITCESTEGGVVYGATTYARGDVVQMSAVPQDGYYFDGWYHDAQIVEIDMLYHFPAVNDTNLQAVFKKKEAGQPVSDYLTGKCGNNTVWSLDENGTLTISGTGKMYDYNYMNTSRTFTGSNPNGIVPWFKYRDQISSVVVENGVTYIGEGAFNKMTLDSIILPETLTALGDYLLTNGGCKSNIIVPDSVTEFCSYTFAGASISSIQLGKGISSIPAYAFDGCASLKSITFPSHLNEIGARSFWGCKNLKSISLPNTLKVIGESAFYSCTGLEVLSIPSHIETVGNEAFGECEALSSIILPESISNIGSRLFFRCTSLKEVSVNATITKLPRTFVLCSELDSVSLPNGLKEIESAAFSGCPKLKKVFIPESVTSISKYAFEECNNFTILGFRNSYAESFALENNIPFEVAENNSMPGDVTGDSDVTMADVVKVNRHVLGRITLTDLEKQAADVTGDKDVTMADVVKLNRYVVGRIKKLAASNGLSTLDDSEATITMGSVIAKPSEKVSIPVTLNNNPGIAGFALEFTLPDGITLNSITADEVLKEGTFTQNGNAISWYTTDNVTQNGTILNLNVTAPLTTGGYTVKVALKEIKASNFTNEDSNNVGVSFEAGTLTVVKSSSEPETKPETDSEPTPVDKGQNTITAKDTVFRTYNKKKNQTFSLGAKTKGGAKLSYKSSNKKVTVKNGKVTVKKGFMGQVTITVTAAETAKYKKAQKKITLMVGPSASKLSGVKWDKKKKVVNVSWKKNTTGKGYEVQYSTDKRFKKSIKTVKIKKNSTVKTAIKKIKKGTYYVRIRTINGKTYSDWSKPKTVKVK